MASFVSSPRKRTSSQVEFEDLSSITQTESRATVHGMVTSFSPMKQNAKKCFDGYMSDGRKRIRFVGFQQKNQDKIAEITKEGKPVVLSNCSVKKARSGDGLELIVNDQTEINKSPKKFEIQAKSVELQDTNVSKEIALKELEVQLPFQRVTIKAKVLEIGDTSKLDDGRQVQHVLVADDTTTVEVAPWQEFVNTVTLSKSYELSNLMVKTFNDRVTLFTPQQNVHVKEIDNLENVVSLVQSIKRTKSLPNAKVIAVSNFSSGLMCISCNTGYIEPITENQEFGRCTHCPTTVLLKTCNLRVSALLTLFSGGFQIKLSASDSTLASIAELPLNEITDLSLLSAPPFTVVYNNNMTIAEISR